MDNGSGETVQDAQRGQNRQAEPGGEYFVYFWTGRGGKESPPLPLPLPNPLFFLLLEGMGCNGILRRCRPLIRLVFFPVATHIDGYCRNDNDAFNNILHIGIDADKGKTAFDQAKDHRANQGAGNAPHSAH